MKKILTVALSLSFLLMAPPLGLVQPAQAQNCKVVGANKGKPIIEGDCSRKFYICPNGMIVTRAYDCIANNAMTPANTTASAPAPTAQKCPDGSEIPAKTAAAGLAAIRAWCTAAAAGTTM